MCTTFMGVVTNFGGLVGLRFALGVFEAGLFPGKIKQDAQILVLRF